MKYETIHDETLSKVRFSTWMSEPLIALLYGTFEWMTLKRLNALF